MDFEDIKGRWLSSGSKSVRGEIPFINEETDPNGVKDWLNGNGEDLIEQIDPGTGLTINIYDDYTFSEIKEGEPNILWFSDEGILESTVSPFDGVIKSNGKAFYIQPKEIPSWATANDNYGVITRYDDGDTIISDLIYLHNDSLVRTINVVTDELYLDRIVIVYSRL